MKKPFLKLSLLLLPLLLLVGCRDHSHQYSSEIASAAACTKEGVMQYTCECGDSYTAPIPAEGHTWDAGSLTEKPDCTHEGARLFTCTACGETKTEPVPATGEHSFRDSVITKAPTCSAAGEALISCSTCGKEITTAVSATGKHTFGEAVITRPATCAADGEKTRTCTGCGLAKTESIPAAGAHTWNTGTVTKAATCAADGVRSYTCTACGETKTEAIPKGSAHTFGGATVVKPATCETEGTVRYVCTVCGVTKTAPIAKTDDHRWNGGVVTRAATCGGTGTLTYTCSVCHATRTQSIAATGKHTWETKITKAPTATEPGTETEICRLCNQTGSTRTIPVLSGALAEEADPFAIRTAYNDFAFVNYILADDILTVSGVVTRPGVNQIALSYTAVKLYNVTPGAFFTLSVSLSELKEGEKAGIRFGLVHYPGLGTGFGNTISASHLHTDAVVERKDGVCRFVESPCLAQNLSRVREIPDPQKYLADVSGDIKALSDEIVGNERNDLKKMYLLYKWVAENVYSDTSMSAYTNAATAYSTRRGTSSAYTSLLIALLQAQDIPAMRIGVYRASSTKTGMMTVDDAAATEANYNCVEAYLASENRWVIIDPTAASKNKYVRGELVNEAMEDFHFDITLRRFSMNTKIIERPRSW